MRRAYLALAVPIALWSTASHARPVSYPEGWTVIEETNRQTTGLWVHYTVNPKFSIGYRNIWDRRADAFFQGVQGTGLIKRWFGKDHQANLYGFGAVGAAVDLTGEEGWTPAGVVGGLADWETRRLFVSYQVQTFQAGRVERAFSQAGRVGFAPYVANAGALHTWLMVEVDHRPENDRPVGVTPLVRFFKGAALLELGVSVTDRTPQPLANFTYRF